MIEKALHDLARDVEEWQPPGALSHRVCVSCVQSPYFSAAELEGWPHAVVHPFVRGLESVAQIESGRIRAAHEERLAARLLEEDFFDAHEEESFAEFERRLNVYDSHARTLVVAELKSNQERITDVLQFGLGARLDHYVGQSLATLLSQLRDGSDTR